MKKIIRILCFFVFVFFARSFSAQEPNAIKVKREQNLIKIYFDNTDPQLIPIDRFGNPKENKVKSYKLWIKGKSGPFTGYDNKLSAEMLQALNKLKKATKIVFTEINVEDDYGHLINLPDVYEVWFPTCKNCDNKSGKK